MNIFALSTDPACGRYLNNKHIVKMPLESAQMLSTVLGGGEGLYKPAYKNHPCTLWTGLNNSNFLWLVSHALHICSEYTHRFGKFHASEKVIRYAASLVEVTEDEITPFAVAMDNRYIISTDPVVNYRNYYIRGKNHLADWRSNKPVWYDKPDWYDLNKYPI